jgi:class 3 adenylate cyclase/tetratricopeptide (TPR) repeat protein
VVAGEQRKVVTVLFCDVTGSTELGEQLDPEALRALLADFFERVRAIIERHGGSVEKFIGDAVMAVFGVPVAHEDDALRAVHAVAAIRDSLPELDLQARFGVNTGEVVTGTEERLATGDAVNVAARLEQAARPGEVLLGAETLGLVKGAVDWEAVEPLRLKGKREPVAAFRLLSVREAPERTHRSRFVGRRRELGQISEAWQRARAEQRCQLTTIVADAGVGKTRLVLEALPGLDATAVGGRCLSFGEGITYWPVVEVVKQLEAPPSDAAAAAAIRSLLAGGASGTSAEEIAWAFRKLLEESAPIVCFFEDVHWGEETFLDLVEQTALLSTNVPILLLCAARPELIARRPEWPVALRLAPLDRDEVELLIPRSFDQELRAQIVGAAGGNPLFVTEMVAMAVSAGGVVSVPPSLRALLAARLDQLARAERRVLECAAVEGEIFHRGAVQALASQVPQVTARLAALVRRGLVQPERAHLRGEDGFRFRHVLLRDATYEALPKSARADLHRRYAEWLDQHGTSLVELDEILGHHLERAARYAAELGRPDPPLAGRAGDRLAAAGRRALDRGDNRAAASLLNRALELTRPYRFDVGLELDLAEASAADPRTASAIAEAAAERAGAADDKVAEAVSCVVADHFRQEVESDYAIDEVQAKAEAALALLEPAVDHAGLARVWDALGAGVANYRGRCEDWAQAAQQAIRHYRLAGRTRTDLFGLPHALVMGPRPADEALAALEEALPAVPHPNSLLHRAWLLAMLERFDEAWTIAREASQRLEELTGSEGGQWFLAEVASLAGDHQAAVRHLRRWCEFLEARELSCSLSTFAARLGRSLCTLGRYDEAESLATLGRELGGEHDAATQLLWRQVQGRVSASRGEHATAEILAEEAVAIAGRTDWLNDQANTLLDLAEVHIVAGRPDEAAVALNQALRRYEKKNNSAMVVQVLPRLQEVGRPRSLTASRSTTT